MHSGTFEVSSRRMHCQRIPSVGGESVVVNLQDFLAGGGTHWVCAFRDPALRADEGGVDYFDSFGLPPPDVVKVWLARSGRVMYSGNEVQDRRSIMCGWYCLLFLHDRAHGRSATDILLDFDPRPSARNEHIVQEFARTAK